MNGGMYRPPSDRFGGNANPMNAAATEGVQRIADAAERQAAALEGLLALARAHVTPAAATVAPADRDSVQQAFDAKMGDPLTTLGDLSPFAELTRNVPIGIAMNDAQPGEELRVKVTFKAPAQPDPQLVAERQAAYDAALAHYDAIALRGTRKQKDDACRAIDEAEQALTLARFPGYDPDPAARHNRQDQT